MNASPCRRVIVTYVHVFPSKWNGSRAGSFIPVCALWDKGLATWESPWRAAVGATWKFRRPKYKFRHPKYKFRHPKYSGISSDTQSISSDTQSISSNWFLFQYFSVHRLSNWFLFQYFSVHKSPKWFLFQYFSIHKLSKCVVFQYFPNPN